MIYALLRRTYPSRATGSVRIVLDRISSSYDVFAPFLLPQFRFRAPVPPDKGAFNHEEAIYLLWVESCLVLHVVCTHTIFQGAAELRYKSAEDVWAAFRGCWMYLLL